MVSAFIGSCTQASRVLFYLPFRSGDGRERFPAVKGLLYPHQEAGVFAGAHTVITKALSSSASTEWRMPG